MNVLVQTPIRHANTIELNIICRQYLVVLFLLVTQ